MKSLILIDVAGIYHAAWHTSKDLEFGEAFERTVRKVHSLAEGYDHCCVTYDIGPYLRLGISPDYKGNREKQSDVFYDQYKRVRDRLEKDGFCVLGVKGYESDDLIATIVDQLRGKYSIRIASADKDLCQLVCDADYISVASHMTGNVMTDDSVREKFGVNPADMLDFLALIGDKSDNVAGVPSVGPVLAAKIINSPEGIVGVLAGESTDAVTERVQKLVREHRDTITKARQLITLMTDVPVDVNEIFKERIAQPLVSSNEKFEEEEKDMPGQVTDAEFTDENLGTLFGDKLESSNSPRTAELRDSERVPEVPALQVPPVTKPAFKPEQQSTALAKVTVRFEDELEPRSLANASILSDKIVNSRLYQNFSNSDATLGIILAGREMGMRAMESLRAFHMVEGKPALHAHLIVARAKAHSDCEYFQMIESTQTSATYETKNRNNKVPTRLTYTLEQAQQAGLAPAVMRKSKPTEGDKDARGNIKDNRGNWEKRPDEMIRKTCAVQLARIEYPDAAMGLYCPEELGDQTA